MRERLREAQDLLGHAVPSGDLAQVFDRALILLVADLKRRKFAATRRPVRGRPAAEDARKPVAEVRRGATARDGGRCAFVAKDGHRCGERRFLEFHHIQPYAAGGRATLDNIQLRCRAHNGYEVDRFFGPGKRFSRESAADGTRSGTSTGLAAGSGSGAAPQRKTQARDTVGRSALAADRLAADRPPNRDIFVPLVTALPHP
jgi:hypothetical protein